MLSDLDKVRKKIEKTKVTLAELYKEKDKLLAQTKFKCTAVLEKGTLFERTCGAEYEIKDMIFYEHLFYSNEAYNEGWDLDFHAGHITCPDCKTTYTERDEYDYALKKYIDNPNSFLSLKKYFKEVQQHKRR